jgi:ATP-dependent Clp protease ATP-binding subunit ClpA
LLLGILREDYALTLRLLRTPGSSEIIRKQIEAHSRVGKPIPTSVELPLTEGCKHVLVYATEEADRLASPQITTGHLLLALMREEECFAAQILRERGLHLPNIREELARAPDATVPESEARGPVSSIVTISSAPSGADITVDDVFLGHTPAVLPLAPGERAVSISKEGYKPRLLRLMVLPGAKQTIIAELDPAS